MSRNPRRTTDATGGIFCLSLLACCCFAGASVATEQPAAVRPQGEGITIRKEHTLLGELLEEAGAQSKTPLALHKDDVVWASGIPMVVSIRNMKLRVLMDSLERLFTHKFNTAEWRPTPNDRPGYVLRFGRRPEVAASLARAELTQMVKNEAREQHRLSHLPREARLAAARANPALSRPSFLEHPLMDLFPSLSSAELEAALDGAKVVLPYDRLAPAARAATNLGVTARNEARNTPRPGAISFQMSQHSLGVGPSLAVANAEGLSTNIAGGPSVDKVWVEKDADGWLTPGNPMCLKAQKMLESKRPSELTHFPAASVFRHLILLAESEDRDLLADYDYSAPRGSGPMLRLDDWKLNVALFARYKNFMFRDDSKVLLARTVVSLVSDRSSTGPWPVYKQLRQSAAQNGGFLSLDDYERLSEIPFPRMRTLSRQLGGPTEELQQLLPLLWFRSRLIPAWAARLSSEEGLALRDAGVGARLQLLTPGEAAAAEAGPLPLRLLQSEWPRLRVRLWMEDAPPPVRSNPRLLAEGPVRLIRWAIYRSSGDREPVYTWSARTHQTRALDSRSTDPPLPPRTTKDPARAESAPGR